MRSFWLCAAAAAAFGACSSGSSGCGQADKPKSGAASSFSGGGANPGGGGGEAVSFQGAGFARKLQAPKVAASTAPVHGEGEPAPGASDADARAAAAARAPAQSILCGGFPNLPDDCLGSPDFPQVAAKCCPNGVVLTCKAIPGGAKLTGRGCAAPSPAP